jgi:uncharacterized protein with NRDE domain
MCVIYIAFDQHPDHPLILLANRDEFYERPTAAASYWDDFPNIYGGCDLKGGGTWLGVTRSGRFAAVTNHRDPSAPVGTRSRGNLVADFLKSDQPAKEYLASVEFQGKEYSGFNLLVGEIGQRRELFYFSNCREGIRELSSGLYGLSNHLLDTAWPKVARGKLRFAELLRSSETSINSFFDILSDEALAADEDLPSTGIPYKAEKAVSAIFIKTPGYGTRSSTVLRFDKDLKWSFEERVFV